MRTKGRHTVALLMTVFMVASIAHASEGEPILDVKKDLHTELLANPPKAQKSLKMLAFSKGEKLVTPTPRDRQESIWKPESIDRAISLVMRVGDRTEILVADERMMGVVDFDPSEQTLKFKALNDQQASEVGMTPDEKEEFNQNFEQINAIKREVADELVSKAQEGSSDEVLAQLAKEKLIKKIREMPLPAVKKVKLIKAKSKITKFVNKKAKLIAGF